MNLKSARSVVVSYIGEEMVQGLEQENIRFVFDGRFVETIRRMVEQKREAEKRAEYFERLVEILLESNKTLENRVKQAEELAEILERV